MLKGQCCLLTRASYANIYSVFFPGNSDERARILWEYNERQKSDKNDENVLKFGCKLTCISYNDISEDQPIHSAIIMFHIRLQNTSNVIVWNVYKAVL